MEQAAGEAAYVANAEDRARHGHGKHGHRLDKPLGFKLPLDDEIRDDHAQKRGDRRGDQTEQKRIAECLEAVVAREHELEPLAREREELVAPRREAGTDRHTKVHHDNKDRHERAEHRERDLDAPVGDEHAAAGCLAGERGGSLALKIVLLYGEHRKRDAEKNNRHRRGAGLVVSAGDLEIDGRCERIIGAADDHGVGKVGDGLDERYQKRVAETRQQQRERHAREHLPARSAHVAGGFFERGVNVFQESLEHHVAHGEERQRLHDGDAPEAVHAVIVDLQQEAGDDAGLAEEHDHRKAEYERRRDDRQHGDHLEKPTGEFAHADVHFHIREQQTNQRRQNADKKADFQRVCDGVGKGRYVENALENAEAEPAVAHKAVHQQYGERIENKKREECDQHDDGRYQNGVTHQFLPIQRRALCSCHRRNPS